MQPELITGDLLDQDTDAIVNPWNRNIIPWWLLLPQGVSGAIKRRAGYQPFVELGRMGPIGLGKAVITSVGKLPHQAIIPVAGINMLWRASAASIQNSVHASMALVAAHGFKSVAFPIIGGGSGGFDQNSAHALMLEVLESIETSARVVVVRFRA